MPPGTADDTELGHVMKLALQLSTQRADRLTQKYLRNNAALIEVFKIEILGEFPSWLSGNEPD